MDEEAVEGAMDQEAVEGFWVVPTMDKEAVEGVMDGTVDGSGSN